MVTAAFLVILFLINQEENTNNYEPYKPAKETITEISIINSTSNYTLMVPKDICEAVTCPVNLLFRRH